MQRAEQCSANRSSTIIAGVVPAWFAQQWRHCGLRPVLGGLHQVTSSHRINREGGDHWSFYLLRRGSLRMLDSERDVTVTAPAAWIVPPFHRLREECNRQVGKVEMLIAVFDVLTPAGCSNPLERLDLPAPVTISKVEDAAAMVDLFTEQFINWHPKDLDHLIRARSPLDHHICTVLLDGFKSGVFSTPRPGRIRSAPRWLEDLGYWICTKATDPGLTLNAIVTRSGFSSSQVSHAFTQHFGVGPIRFLRQERMRLASRLLQVRRDESISAIAGVVGYPNSNLFWRHFHQAFGCSPRQWRQAGTKINDPLRSPS